jgi:hypothetical protein
LAGSGSALIMYGMYLNTTNEHPNLVAGSPIGVPAEFKPMLAEPTEVGYHAVSPTGRTSSPRSTRRHRAPGKLEVIGSQRGPSFGHAY